MPRPTLSAVMIVRDEEANLRALTSYWREFDEVIIVDGGSRDRSLDVARRSGVTVVCRPFDNFAAQRNFARSLARGSWLLSFDADERPTAAMLREVRQQIVWNTVAAYRVPIRSTIFGRPFRYSGTQHDRPIRLFRRGAAAWRGDVHEVLTVQGRVSSLQYGLEHHTLPDLSAFLAKMNRYTTLEAAARVAAQQPPGRYAKWSAPLVEIFRRLIWKHGWLDGPEGWAFCALSGLSAHVLAERHRRGWESARQSAIKAPGVTREHQPTASSTLATAHLSARA